MATGNFTTFPVPFRSGDEFIAETKDVRDEVLVLKSDTDGLKTQAVTARDEAEGFRDSAETIAAAVGDVAGLPSLTGNANRALQVNSAGDAVLWGTDLTFAAVEQFDTSGTWTKDPDARWVMVEAWGAGNGGNTDDGALVGASGGDYAFQVFRAEDLPATVLVTVGAGGLGAPPGAFGIGAAGGDTSFGSFLTSNSGFSSSTERQTFYGGAGRDTDGVASMYGGGGGAGGGSFTGGASKFGGDGGDSGGLGVIGGNGQAPGGGGATGRGSTTGDYPGGGDGGDGRLIVRQW